MCIKLYHFNKFGISILIQNRIPFCHYIPSYYTLLNLICQQCSAYDVVSLLYAGYIKAVNAWGVQIRWLQRGQHSY